LHRCGRIFALDNRCPHIGFPLERGSVEDGILTCHWHHARFDHESGCTFDLWADDVPICPVKMRRVVRPDPFVEEEFARNEATKKPWVKAEPSSHIWAARLPAELEPGTHRVAVHVIDEYGREHRDHLVLE
jgi:hypothetical protein